MGATQAISIEQRLSTAYDQLKKVHPDHELLKVAQKRDSGRFNFSQEYYMLFVDSKDDFGTIGLARYSNALEKAVKD